VGSGAEKTDLKALMGAVQLELDPAAITVRLRGGNGSADALGLNAGSPPEGFGQDLLFGLQLGGILQMLPGTAPTGAEMRTGR